MDLYTLNRDFHKQDVIDEFSSCIWTERYFGDSNVELVVPAKSEMIKKLPEGIFLSLDGSDEVMILETTNNEAGKIKFTGMSILPWLNNRFVRTTAVHANRYWYISGMPPGQVLWHIVYSMCCQGSLFLDGTVPTGVINPEQLVIPGLTVKAYDTVGDNIDVAVSYGPVYDVLREIATAYEIGMQITLDSVTDDSYSLGFRSYRGLNRTSNQTVNPVVRFSPDMDSLTDIKELRSIAALKTLALAFAPGNPGGLATGAPAGVDILTGPQYTGFDLRALQVFAEDITTDQLGGLQANLIKILNSRAHNALISNKFIGVVDGEIIPTNQFKYGAHYNLGDLIEIQGNTEIIQVSRVTEYIRAQDEAGEREYPTVEALSEIGEREYTATDEGIIIEE